MNKLLALVVIAAFLFSGCGINTEQISGSDINEGQNITEDKSELPTPPLCEMAWEFKTEQEFMAAIKDSPAEGAGSRHSLKGIEYYFVPETVPEGMILDHIAVKDFYVALWYTYDKEPDPYWERLFIFEWCRTKTTEDTSIKIEKVKPWDGYEGDQEYVCQDVYWGKDGYAFHAVVPIWFTEEDIEKYCVAKKVDLK